jgi:hypothetical protein
MNRSTGIALVLAAGLVVSAGAAQAKGLGVEIWTDRGNEAVYQPGDEMHVNVKTTDDSYLLVYEIDTDGFIHVLYPYQGQSGIVPGDRTLEVPTPESNLSLVVQNPVGQSYLVAVVAAQPFKPLPTYLRPYNAQEQELGYVGQPNDEEGVTADGRIVGDPFVAMERIRRQVVSEPDAEGSFATAYTTYYVHEEVRYPRYLCYDCHRPNYWAWWDGFDPYYTTCSAFTFRVNWAWCWGPSYWYGTVPYFVYAYRPDCPPRYHNYYQSGVWYSSWDGWNRWNELWGPSGMRRYKTPPPVGYVPPSKWKPGSASMPATQSPPGFMVSSHTRQLRDGQNQRMPAVRVGDGTVDSRVRSGASTGSTVRRPWAERVPASRPATGDAVRMSDRVRPLGENRGAVRPDPVYVPRQSYRPSAPSGTVERVPVGRYIQQTRTTREAARQTPRQAPRVEPSRDQTPPAPAQAPPPAQGRSGGNSGGGSGARVRR